MDTATRLKNITRHLESEKAKREHIENELQKVIDRTVVGFRAMSTSFADLMKVAQLCCDNGILPSWFVAHNHSQYGFIVENRTVTGVGFKENEAGDKKALLVDAEGNIRTAKQIEPKDFIKLTYDFMTRLDRFEKEFYEYTDKLN